MGKNDSTETRVVPVFDHLWSSDCTGTQWVERLIRLGTRAEVATMPQDFGALIPDHLPSWGQKERSLSSPLELLEWLVCNITKEQVARSSDKGETRKKRKALASGDPDVLCEALRLLREGKRGRQWFVLEGQSRPDAYLETDSLVLVVEGKRTEPSPTNDTEWMQYRPQLIRHMDAAWEVAGRRVVLGLLLVEGKTDDPLSVPKMWLQDIEKNLQDDQLASSLPHRSEQERQEIGAGVLGAATWQRVCHEFSIDWPPFQDVEPCANATTG